MDFNKEKIILEEQLREAARDGESETVEKLIHFGVDINARDITHGRTALHWACIYDYFDIVTFLLKNGADRNVKSHKGETPASLSSHRYILRLLGTTSDPSKSFSDSETPTIVPNYIKNTPVNTTLDLGNSENISNKCTEVIVLKIRIANISDPDFIEVDLPRNALTYPNLIILCCDELEINATQIVKLRKLPNTRLRRDKDVQRLEDFQEIEVVLYSSPSIPNDAAHKSMQYANGSTVPITPTNNYQSISKKDQTILY